MATSVRVFCCLFVFVQPVFECFYQSVTQFFGGDFDPSPGSVVLGIVVPPTVIVLPGDLPGLQLLGLFRPGGQHFKHINISPAPGLVQPQTDFTVNLSDCQAPYVLQCKEGVHEANVAIYVRDGQGIGGDFKKARQRPGQVSLSKSQLETFFDIFCSLIYRESGADMPPRFRRDVALLPKANH